MRAFAFLFSTFALIDFSTAEVKAQGTNGAQSLTRNPQATVPLYCDSDKNTEIGMISFPGHGLSVRGDFSASTGYHWASKQNLPWTLKNFNTGNGAPGSGSGSIVFEISPEAMKKHGGFFNPNRSKFVFYFKAPGGKVIATCVVRVIVGSI